MPSRPCVQCLSQLARPGRPRCDDCERGHQRHRNATRPQYRGTWPTEAKRQIAAYRAQHGDVCPGWQREPHDIDPADWTCDHDQGPLCRSCNGSKGGSHDRARAQARRHDPDG